jgi:hypothetical protein
VALLGAVAALLYVGVSAPKSGATTYSSNNLLKGDTASLRHGLGSWAGRSAALSRPTVGVLSIRATRTTTYMGASTVNRGATRATPLRVYSARAAVRTAATSRSVSTGLAFYDRSHKQVSAVSGQPIVDSRSKWLVTPPAVGIAPPNAAYVVVTLVVGSASRGEVHLLSKPTLTVAAKARRDIVGPLHTSGNRIYDSKGQVELRGIHRRGLELPGAPEITQAEMLQAKRWGATMIRLSVSSAYWNKGNCHYDPYYAGRVDKAVKAVTANHMVALIDLHTNTILPCGEVEQQMMADRTALKFWNEVAWRYKGNPLVAFDLYNEPHWIPDEIWLNGGWVTQRTPTPFRAAGMQEMYDVVRASGAKNLVIVTGQDWGNRIPDLRVSGFNIVYGTHIYTCPLSPDKCNRSGTDPTRWMKRWVGPSARVPVMVTEFGWPSPKEGWYTARVISFARQYKWGWLAFGWDGRTDGDFSLISRMGSVFQPSPNGIPVVAGMNFH